MSYVYHTSGSGLVSAYYGSDATAVGRMLKEYDRDLRLVPQGWGYNERILYKVFRRASGERWEPILSWADDNGEPLPLSSALLDKVKSLDKNSRAEYKSADQLEEERKIRQAKERADEAQDIYDDAKSLQGRIPHLTHGKFKGKK